MNRQTSSRLPACPPPADPGSAAVVAHASESSSGAGIPSTLACLAVITCVFALVGVAAYMASVTALRNQPAPTPSVVLCERTPSGAHNCTLLTPTGGAHVL